jgi:tetratricopeptide (TPR) repeat protein
MNLQDRLIDLETAIREIQHARQEPSGEILKNSKSPFFFVVGAGISFPPVPLAPMIAEYCKNEAANRNSGQTVPIPDNPMDAMEEYSYYFRRAFPQAGQRQTYMRSLIEGKPISKANLRLAHLLSEDGFTDLVVTPNFDDFLARALSFFGKFHISCDHDNDIARIDAAKNSDIKIVQVHGSYWFYDCKNLDYEIAKRAQRDEESSQNMASYLDAALAGRSPLVMGYSGWERDVIMSALKRRLRTSLKTNLYWFCYKKSNVGYLPDWLKNHPNVFFVVPSSMPMDELPSKFANPNGVGKHDDILSAQTVFEELLKECKLPAPRITKEPLRFFADQIESLFDGSSSEDIYLIKDVIERVHLAEELLLRQQNKLESYMESVRDALRRLDYEEAVDKFINLVDTFLDASTDKQLQSFVNLMLPYQSNIDEIDHALQLNFYESVLRLIDKRLRLNTILEEKQLIHVERSRFLFHKGVTLCQLGRLREGIDNFDEVEKYGNDGLNSLIIQESLAWSLFNKGVALENLAIQEDYRIFEEAVKIYSKIDEHYGGSTVPVIREAVARSVSGKGTALAMLEKTEDAIAVFDELEKRYGDSEDVEIREIVDRGLVNKGVAYGKLSHLDKDSLNKALATFDKIGKRSKDSNIAIKQEVLSQILLNKGIVLGALENFEEAITYFERVERSYAFSSELAEQRLFAQALINKTIALRNLKNFQKAIDVCNEVCKRFENETDAFLGESVTRATYLKTKLLEDLH